jgi:uncharacterized protein YkwD
LRVAHLERISVPLQLDSSCPATLPQTKLTSHPTMPSATASLALAAAAVLTSAVSAVPAGLSRGCVLDAAGYPVCTRLDDGRMLGMGFAPLVRPITCDDGDAACFCMRAVGITNDIRARNGAGGDLVAGTLSMLANAVKHSKKMSDTSMDHQDLGTASDEVGCGVFINRENIAMFSGIDKDPAVQCMEQWEGSSGHFANIVGAVAGDYLAIGIIKSGEEWWCTQTFGKPGDGECPMITSSSGGGSTPTEAPIAVVPENMPMPVESEGGSGDGEPPTTEAPVVTFMDETKDEPRTTIVAGGDSSEQDLPGDDTFASGRADNSGGKNGGGKHGYHSKTRYGRGYYSSRDSKGSGY